MDEKEHTPQSEDQPEVQPVAVKGDFELDVLGHPFGGPFEGKDKQGQYFDEHTNFHADKFPTLPVVYYHSFNPDGTPQSEPAYIGTTVKRWMDSAGEWFRVRLDDTLDLSRRVIEAAKRGAARASSGAAAHLCRYDPDGHIREWPSVELSVFDLGDGRTPANPYAVAIPAVKAMYDRAGLTFPADIEAEPDAVTPTGPSDGQDTEEQRHEDVATKSDNQSQGVTEMEEKDIQKLVADGVAAALKAQQEAAQAEADKKAAFDAAVKAEVDKRLAASRRLPGGDGSAPYALKFADTRKFDNWQVEDLACWITFCNNALKSGNQKAQPLGHDIYRALALKINSNDADARMRETGLKAMGLAFTDQGMPLSAIKSDEIMQYDLANYGDEWVRVLYSESLWYKIRFGTPVLDRMAPYMVEVNNAEELKLLLEGSDVTWYKVAEAASLPTTEATGVPNATFTTSRMGSDSQSITLGKAGARVLVSGELGASTPIAVVSEVRRQMEVTGREVLENILINGDTTDANTTNINDIAGDPAGDEAFLIADGFRHLPLATNTDNLHDVSTLGIDDFKTVLSKMGTGGQNAFADPSKVSFILDVNTYVKALELTELKTQDVYGNDMTLRTGKLPPIYGVDTIMSTQMHKVITSAGEVANGGKANNAGKIDQDTLENNAYGAILAVRWDQWRMGYRRMMEFETTRIARADVTELVSLAEIGVVYRDTEASALGYNVAL
jgi:hypothetical protein